MKTLLITLAAFVILFVIGCQENSITDPVTSESTNKVQIPDVYPQGIIPLKGMLNDPHPVGNSFYIINGQIKYEFRIASLDMMRPAPRNYVSLHFSTDADFKYLCTVCAPSENDVLVGVIKSETEENLFLTGSFLLFEESFVIQGREDGMVLKCKFLVTTGRVELKAMWLALPPQNNQIINNH